jgi:hypothetical protein
MSTITTRATRLRKAKGLLNFHRWVAQRLAVARRCGTTQTTKSYRSALLTNAKVLRSKLLVGK